ncbi:MAG TPA: DUF3048 domain-containing protein [Patescibacteria group bacterium]|nr:DUF3048 domain-containing protein [Patescibacteria group bacterium]
MNRAQKIIIAVLVVIVVAGGGYYFYSSSKSKSGKQIETGGKTSQEAGVPLNSGNVSPISGLACPDWNRRAVAVMQPADVAARPAAGFSDADMVVEMPVITASITRLMGVYVCGNPDDVGSMRSARHDFLSVAAGLDAIFVHWGRSNIEKFKEVLNSKQFDDINCNDDAGNPGLAPGYCYRKEATGTMRGVDTGYAKFSKLIEGAQHYGFRMTNNFSGYPHQEEAVMDQRPSGGHLRVAFAGPFAAEYDYDKASNSYKRIWGNVADSDRNNGKPLTPKNVVVLMATSDQLVEGEQYNNVQLGDPWFDTNDSGDAYYYFNGQEIKGTWKKDKSKATSKLMMLDASGQEVKFVPGQIWLEVLEPGQTLRWTPTS